MENGRPGLRVKKKTCPWQMGERTEWWGGPKMVDRRGKRPRQVDQQADVGRRLEGGQTRQITGRRTCRRSTAEVETHELQLCCRDWSLLDPNPTISGGASVDAGASIASMGFTGTTRPLVSADTMVAVTRSIAMCLCTYTFIMVRSMLAFACEDLLGLVRAVGDPPALTTALAVWMSDSG